jgi:type II secretory pathway pseudopilin PulG
LAELLVVVAIIGLLAALITPALYRVVLRARENRIAQEVSQLHQAIESYKQKHGDYPPDFSSVSAAADLSDVNNIVVRHLRKAFPRHQEDLVAYFTTNGIPDRAEALVFWLTQLGTDPRKPLTGTGDKDAPFPFDAARLKKLNGHNWASYLPKDGGETPYVYFENRTYATTGGYTINSETVRPYKRKIGNAPYPYANPTTYQIICAGLDAEFGDTAATKAKGFPDGLADAANLIDAYTPADMDNITNFSEGRTLQESRE